MMMMTDEFEIYRRYAEISRRRSQKCFKDRSRKLPGVPDVVKMSEIISKSADADGTSSPVVHVRKHGG